MSLSKSCKINLAIILLVILSMYPSAMAAYPYEFEINSPYWNISFSRAGYVDITYWYPSPRHPFNAHEMMTGDWAVAVYYDGINSGSN